MLLNELFIDEDVGETKDLMAITRYIAQWMVSPKNKHFYNGIALTLPEIEEYFERPIPEIKSEHLEQLLFWPFPDINRPIKFVTNHPTETRPREFGVYFPPPLYMINVNLENINLKRKGDPSSTILHELQHALDYHKSRGNSFNTPYAEYNNDMQKYLTHPMEINARFSQALWHIASNHETINRSNAYKVIENSLDKFLLGKGFFKDPKNHKRLIIRAYKFLDDVKQIVADEPTFMQRVKTLIKKWLVK